MGLRTLRPVEGYTDMDAVSEARLVQIFQPLSDKIRMLYAMLESEGVVVRVTQALRSWSQQDSLYQEGRELIAGAWQVTGKIVTNCPGGHSYHNFGLAVDVCPSSQPEGQPFTPDWDVNHPEWRRIEEVGVSLGLDSGADWRTFKDYPHLQLTGRFPEGQPTDEVRQLFKDGGSLAVWEEVQKSIQT